MLGDPSENSSSRKPLAEINVVPYVDVMLVLLVIFMATAPLLTQGVVVELPETGAQAITETDEPPLIVTVDALGNYFLNIHEPPTKALMPDNLSAEVMAALKQNPRRSVLVRGDDQVNYGKVVGAMVLLQEAGVDKVGLVTAPLSDNRE